MPSKLKLNMSRGKAASTPQTKPAEGTKPKTRNLKGKEEAAVKKEPVINDETDNKPHAKLKDRASSRRFISKEDAKWRQTNKLPPKYRVAIKERARTYALLSLRRLKQHLIDLEYSFPNLPEIKIWKEEIGELFVI